MARAAAPAGDAEASHQGGWPNYVISWTKARVGIVSSDCKRLYTLGNAGKSLRATALEGGRPDTILNDVLCKPAGPSAPEPASRRGGEAAAASGWGQPVACVLMPNHVAEEGHDYLLVLLASGQLIALNSAQLGVEGIVAVFPDVSSEVTTPLAGLGDLGWAVVAEGSRLSLVEVDTALAQGGKVSGKTPVDLPKGCIAQALLSYPGSGSLLLVGCSNGQVILFQGTTSQKGLPTLVVVHTVDIEGQPVAAGSGTGFRAFFRRQTAAAGAGSASRHAVVGMAAIDGGGQDGWLAAAGRSPVGSAPSGGLSVWRTAVAQDTAPGGEAAKFAHLAFGRSKFPILRVLLIAPRRVTGMGPLLLSFDVSANLTVWAVQPGAITALSTLGLGTASAPKAAVVARTFAWVGSVYLVISTGARLGWLDALLLLRQRPLLLQIGQPLSSSVRTALPPSLGATEPAIGSALEVAAGGEVFFVSEGELQRYSVARGKAGPFRLSPPPEITDWRLVGVLDAFFGSSEAPGATHLLLEVLEALASGAVKVSAKSVWLVGSNGDFVLAIPGALDAAFVGRRQADARVVYLSWDVERQVPTVHVAAVLGSAGGAMTVAAQGVERVFVSPPTSGGGQWLFYWGSQLPGGPLRVSQGSTREQADRLAPSRDPPLALPLRGPLELVDVQWDHRKEEGPWCVALAAAYAIWVLQIPAPAATASGTLALELIAWVDLPAAIAGAGRALSVCWLRPASLTGASGTGAAHAGLLLVSTPSSVVAWTVRSARSPRNLVLCDRPMLLAGALIDRLLCVETQLGTNLLGGADRGQGRSAGRQGKALSLSAGPRARMRARPVSFFEAVLSTENRSRLVWVPAAVVLQSSDWRISPSELPRTASQEASQRLWPAAVCSEAPPQLVWSASTFQQMAVDNNDQFRGLAAIVSTLSASGGGRRGRATARAGDELRAAETIEDSVREIRAEPSRLSMLQCAGELLVDCAAQASGNKTGLELVGKGLARHDFLPFGALTAAAVCSARPLLHMASLLDANTPGKPASPSEEVPERFRSWAQVLTAPPPLVSNLWKRLDSKPHELHREDGADFSASALLQQSYLEPPKGRPLQVVQPGGQGVAQLHTATLLQWLGLGSTELLVRDFRSILSTDAEESPTGTTPGASSASAAAGPPAILASGLLLCWRCADGEGTAVRDSVGCNREGLLDGASEWRGPLPPDDPMEHSDEWSTALAPNFAIALGRGGQLRYGLAEGGAAASADRQMLALLGSSRAEGERHLALVRAAAVEQDEEEQAELLPGWTVEFWARLEADASGDLRLFSRGDGGGRVSLSWTYACTPPRFTVLVSGRTVVIGDVEALPEDEWVHLALRSDLKTVQITVNGQLALYSSAGVLALSAPVPEDAGLSFGPAPGLELTEVRVWGVYRPDLDLDLQRQPLPGLLPAEKKVEAWRKVKIRAGPAGSPTGGDTFGLWGLTDLVAPASVDKTGAVGRSGKAPAEKKEPMTAWDEWQDPWAGAQAEDPWGADPWGGAAQLGDTVDWPGSTDFPSAEPAPPAPAPPGPSAPSEAAAASSSAAASRASGRSGDQEPVPSEPPAPSEHLPSEHARSWERPSFEPHAPASWHAPEPPAPAGAGVATAAAAATGAAAAAAAAAAVAASRRPGSEQAPSSERSPSEHLTVERPPSEHPSREEPAWAWRPPSEHETEPPPSEHPPSEHPPSERPASERPPSERPPSERPPVVRPPSVRAPSERAPSERAPSERAPSERAPSERPKPPALPVRRVSSQPPDLIEVLPPAAEQEAAAVSAVDQSLRVAARALERRVHNFAEAAFRASFGKLARLLPNGSWRSASPAVRVRFEAAAAYGTLAALLRDCEELALAASSSKDPAAAQEELCVCWSCVLRVPKAPRHTVLFAVQAMSNFFSKAPLVGGWGAARQVAKMLLERWRGALSKEQLEQVLYVQSVTGDGHNQYGYGKNAGECPKCRSPLPPLEPSCKVCLAEVVVCFRDRRFCDARTALFCTLCAAADSGRPGLRGPGRGQWRPGAQGGRSARPGSGSVMATQCPICGVGELRRRGHRQPGTRENVPY